MEMNELFYKNPYLTEFDAEVLSCVKGKKDYEVILSDTAFYPEGGGEGYPAPALLYRRHSRPKS